MLMDESLEIILRILPLIVGPILGYLMFLSIKHQLFSGRDMPYDATITKVELNPANGKKVTVDFEFQVNGQSHNGSSEETIKKPDQFMVGAKYKVYSNKTGESYPISEKNYKMACGIFIAIAIVFVTGFLAMAVNTGLSSWGR